MASFAGKVAIVTGSTAGIGQAVALLIAQRGGRVVLHGTNQKRLDQTLEMMQKMDVPGSRLHHCLGPIEQESVQEKLISEAVGKFGQLDVLVNNAGTFHPPGVDDFDSLEAFDKVIALNLRSCYNLCRMATPHLEKTKGNIVNNSSLVSVVSHGLAFPYEMSKAALNQMTRSFALVLGPKGVRCNAVLPYVTATNIFDVFGVTQQNIDEKYEVVAQNRIPLRRVAKPIEVAEMMVFLASDRASYVSGNLIQVDGGTLTGWDWRKETNC